MALLWRKVRDGVVYEVRSAGRSRRFYIDGLLNSQYNPAAPLSGNLWELLALPALLATPPPRRVLVLGVGGGAVIRQLERMVAPERIVGVERDPLALEAARRYFGVKGPRVSLQEMDARTWLGAYRGAPFDLVIDDLYTEEANEPVRAVPADLAWFRALGDHLTPGATVVFNHIGDSELRASAAFTVPAVMRQFPSALRLTGPRFENAVLALYRRPPPSPVTRRQILRQLRERTRIGMRRPEFAIRRLR